MIKIKGTPGIEPGTSRSAVECSTPELYPLDISTFTTTYKQNELRCESGKCHGALIYSYQVYKDANIKGI